MIKQMQDSDFGKMDFGFEYTINIRSLMEKAFREDIKQEKAVLRAITKAKKQLGLFLLELIPKIKPLDILQK